MDRPALIKILKSVSPALARMDFVPLHACFCFDGKSAWAQDGSVLMLTPCELPFRGAIPGSALLQLLESSRAEAVDFTQEGSDLFITMGRTKMRWQMLDCESISVTDPGVILPCASELVRSVQLVAPSAGFDPANASRMGVTIHFAKDRVTFYATNNVTLCKSVVTTSRVPANLISRSVQLSRGFCSLLTGVAKKVTPEHITLGERAIYTRIDSVVIRANLIEGADSSVYEQALSGVQEPAAFMPVSPALTRAIDRADVIAPTLAHISYKDNYIRVYSQSQQCEIADKVRVEGVYPDSQCKIATKYLKELLPDMETIAITPTCVVLCGGSTRRYIAAIE